MSDLELARQTLQAESLAFALVRDGTLIASGKDYGVRQLLAATERLGTAIRGASLADKVVGKAVALIVAHSGIREVDTTIASEGAVALLKGRGIPLHVRTVVPFIRNRRGDGLCPMEQTTLPYDDPAIGVARLREFIVARPV
jgi:hypothetical protein